jgi:threonine synthase
LHHRRQYRGGPPAELAQGDVFAEPAGATAFAGLTKAVSEGTVASDETVVVLMTGSGLKDTDSAMRAAGQAVPVGKSLEDVKSALKDRDTA